MRRCRIGVQRLEVMADIGIHASEVGCPQPLVVDVVLETEAPDRDEIGASVDYTLVEAAVRRQAGLRTGLIEIFAFQVAAVCLDLPAVAAVSVRVEKPLALGGALAWTEVVLDRETEAALRLERRAASA